MIFFSVIFSVLFTYNTVVQDTNQKVNIAVSERVSKDIAQQNEDFTIKTRNVTQNMIGFVVDNTGQELINVVLAYVHEPSGAIADQSNGSKAVFSGSPLFSVGAGASSPNFNTTVYYTGGNYTIMVVTDKGTVRSAIYPALLVTTAEIVGFVEAVEGITTGAIGHLLMNYTTFEMCVPLNDNCEPTSGDWVRGWQVTKDDFLLFRIVIRNTGNATYFLSEKTVVTGLGPMGIASSVGARVFHIKEPPTVGDDDGIPYSPDFGIAITGGSSTTIYFGANTEGEDPLEKFPNAGIWMLVLTLFAFEDVNENGTYESGIDTTPYGQSIPFQAVLSQI